MTKPDRPGWVEAEGIEPVKPINFPYAGANLGGQMVYRCGDPGERGCGALVMTDSIEDHRAWHATYDIEVE